jgi:hypothetical protein
MNLFLAKIATVLGSTYSTYYSRSENEKCLFHPQSIHFLQCFYHKLKRWPDIDIGHLDLPDYTGGIYKDQSPLRGSIGSQHTIGVGNPPMRLEIRQNIKPKASHLLHPGVEGGNVIDA